MPEPDGVHAGCVSRFSLTHRPHAQHQLSSLCYWVVHRWPSMTRCWRRCPTSTTLGRGGMLDTWMEGVKRCGVKNAMVIALDARHKSQRREVRHPGIRDARAGAWRNHVIFSGSKG